ncbi:MAG: Holliday junction branch migration protein RuvA [Anaerolineae bacterium]|nr:Holliday junction branch migration protein RuvA [Chloroflexota bacterium]MBP6298115.1 Holliday junction branch migration protein RuvA [Anaerolineae bacterium]
MIAMVQGAVAHVGKDHVVLLAGGVGYKLFCPPTLTGHGGETLTAWTTLVVREDSMSLYGFASPAERDQFELLLTISGVGPKVGLAILSTLTSDSLRNAVVADRPEILTRVPGIGKKTAQKILFELKDKLTGGLDSAPSAAFNDVNSDVIDTLVALGYSIIEAQTAVQALPPDAPDDVEERIRMALQYFA